jgi:hypothetical protein
LVPRRSPAACHRPALRCPNPALVCCVVLQPFMKLSLAYPVAGTQKLIEVDDDAKLCVALTVDHMCRRALGGGLDAQLQATPRRLSVAQITRSRRGCCGVL